MDQDQHEEIARRFNYTRRVLDIVEQACYKLTYDEALTHLTNIHISIMNTRARQKADDIKREHDGGEILKDLE